MPGSWGRSSILLFSGDESLPEGQSIFLTFCFAHSGEVLFFAPPKKSTQKKGDPGGLPATRVPCASRKARRSRNSLRSNRARASSGLYCDARLRQTGWEGQNRKSKPATPVPFALTEYRSQSGIRRAPCLRQVYLPSCARPRSGEERRESAQPMSAPGCHSLWVLSLGQARESTSPFRAKLGDEKSTSPFRAEQTGNKCLLRTGETSNR